MIELSEADHSKDKGIRGLIQIATRSRDKNTLSQRTEIITRYFSKFQQRMENIGNPITDIEEEQIRLILFEIINKI